MTAYRLQIPHESETGTYTILIIRPLVNHSGETTEVLELLFFYVSWKQTYSA